MAGNTFASVGQRTGAFAGSNLPHATTTRLPSTASQYKSMGQPRAFAVTKAPGLAKGGVTQFPRPKRFGSVPKGVMGVVNTGTFKAGG